jgi:hypothetical protein
MSDLDIKVESTKPGTEKYDSFSTSKSQTNASYLLQQALEFLDKDPQEHCEHVE